MDNRTIPNTLENCAESWWIPARFTLWLQMRMVGSCSSNCQFVENFPRTATAAHNNLFFVASYRRYAKYEHRHTRSWHVLVQWYHIYPPPTSNRRTPNKTSPPTVIVWWVMVFFFRFSTNKFAVIHFRLFRFHLLSRGGSGSGVAQRWTHFFLCRWQFVWCSWFSCIDLHASSMPERDFPCLWLIFHD